MKFRGKESPCYTKKRKQKCRTLRLNDLGNNLQRNAVANQNQGAEPITSYYIMRFVLHAQFMDTTRNTKELLPKQP